MESWKKTLYISGAILFFHTAALGMLVPFLPLFIKELGVSDLKAQAAWSGIIYGIAYAFTALLAPLWGTISDQYGRKPLILRTTLGICVVALLMSFVTNVHQLLVLRIFHGICGGTTPAFIALISRKLPEDKIGQGLGTMQSSLLTGNLVGPFCKCEHKDMCELYSSSASDKKFHHKRLNRYVILHASLKVGNRIGSIIFHIIAFAVYAWQGRYPIVTKQFVGISKLGGKCPYSRVRHNGKPALIDDFVPILSAPQFYLVGCKIVMNMDMAQR